MLKKYPFVVLIFLFLAANISAQQIIAHRGYWKTDGSAQNSVAALMKADSINVFGSEVDIWLSADGVPVVNHDADVSINGNKYVIETTPFNVLRQATLSNGEPLPTVEEYLNAFEKCKNIKLIIEFKNHKSITRENELAQKVIDMVNARNLQDKVEYISFGINFVQQVRKLAPQANVYYLNGDLAPQSLAALGAAGFDYHYNVVYKRPQWVKETQNLGMEVNVWTVNHPDDILKMIDLNVNYITTDEPLLVRKLIEEQK